MKYTMTTSMDDYWHSDAETGCVLWDIDKQKLRKGLKRMKAKGRRADDKKVLKEHINDSAG